MERPKIVEGDYLEYLDELKDSGDVNMFGAATYLAADFNLSRNEAREIVKYWMNTYGKEDR